MKILVVTPTFLPVVGGAELGIYEIYKRIGKHHDVHILTPHIPEYLISLYGVEDGYFQEMNFEIYHFYDTFNLTNIRGPDIFKNLIPPFSISYIRAVFRHIKIFRPDVINFHYVIPGGLSLTLVRILTKIPVVLSLVGRPDVIGKEISFFKRNYIWLVVKHACHTICISKYFIRWPRFGYKRAKIIPYGVDTQRFSSKVNGSEIRKKIGIKTNKIVLFALQRLVKVKRVDVLIRALKYILKENKEVALVIGGKGPEESSLRELAKKLKVGKNVIFIGYISEEECPKYFAMADIFVFHSMHETFGIVLVQAMASGKPIVSVNATAVPEVVDNNVNGILVEPLNHKQFADSVIRLLKDKNLSQRFSINGQKKAHEKYSWDSIAEQYEKIFENSVNSNE